MSKFFQNNFKKIIISIILIIIVLIIIIVIIKKDAPKQEEDKKFQEYLEKRPYDIIPQARENNVGTNEYFTIKGCIDNYYKYKSDLNDNNLVVLFNILNEQFKEEYNITQENIKEIFEKNKNTNFIIEDIVLNKIEDNKYLYFLYGKEINDITEESHDYGFIVILDGKNRTYSIAPYEFMKKVGLEKADYKTQIEGKIKFENIQPKDNLNLYLTADIDEQNMVQFFFKEFKRFSKYDSEYAYKLLDEDYREKRFKDEKIGNDYIRKNVDKIFGYKLEKMAINADSSEYTEYICQDNNGNYFIIRKDYKTVKYSILLDAYTVPVNEFVSKYVRANNAKKSALNIEKFAQMINLKDYEKAYSVLDETFRENNFGSVEKFEQYVKQNWSEFIAIEYINYEDAGEVGTLKVKITNREDKASQNKVENTIIIKLIDENNFSMSFNVEQ